MSYRVLKLQNMHRTDLAKNFGSTWGIKNINTCKNHQETIVFYHYITVPVVEDLLKNFFSKPDGLHLLAMQWLFQAAVFLTCSFTTIQSLSCQCSLEQCSSVKGASPKPRRHKLDLAEMKNPRGRPGGVTSIVLFLYVFKCLPPKIRSQLSGYAYI